MIVYHPGLGFFPSEKDVPDPVQQSRYFVHMVWADGHESNDLISFTKESQARDRRDRLRANYRHGYNLYGRSVAAPLVVCEVCEKKVNVFYH